MSKSASRARATGLAGLLGVVVALSACGGKNEDANLASLDAQLTNQTTDPAARAAIEDKITIDPDLVAQSNRNQIRPADKPINGAVPSAAGHKPSRSELEALAGGTLQAAPAAEQGESSRPSVTLGSLAAAQAQKGKSCGPVDIRYDNSWAGRLPSGMPLIPGAALTEAAGGDNAGCSLRAVSFTTGAASRDVLDFYFTLARRAGFSSSRENHDKAQWLGGAGAKGAYLLILEPQRGGGNAVDLIVTGRF